MAATPRAAPRDGLQDHATPGRLDSPDSRMAPSPPGDLIRATGAVTATVIGRLPKADGSNATAPESHAGPSSHASTTTIASSA